MGGSRGLCWNKGQIQGTVVGGIVGAGCVAAGRGDERAGVGAVCRNAVAASGLCGGGGGETSKSVLAEPAPEPGMYRVAERDKRQIGQPENQPSLPVDACAGLPVADGRRRRSVPSAACSSKWTDPVAGERAVQYRGDASVMTSSAGAGCFGQAVAGAVSGLKAAKDSVWDGAAGAADDGPWQSLQAAFLPAEGRFQVRYRLLAVGVGVKMTTPRCASEAIVDASRPKGRGSAHEHPHPICDAASHPATVAGRCVAAKRREARFAGIACGGRRGSAAPAMVALRTMLSPTTARQPPGWLAQIVVGAGASNVNPRLPFHRRHASTCRRVPRPVQHEQSAWY